MARDYSRVAPAFWTGTTGRELRGAGRDVQLLGLYLMTSPHANMIGLYQLALPTLCHEAGFTIEGASKALRSLSEAGFAFYDEDAEEVWVPAMAHYQVLDRGAEELKPGDKRCKGVERELRPFSKSKFFLPFVRRYKAAFHLPFDAPPEDHASPSEGPSKPHRSQEQEQEQEHAQEAAAAGRARRAGGKRKLGPGAAGVATPQAAEAAPEPTPNPTAERGQAVAEKPGEPASAAPASPGPHAAVGNESPRPETPATSDAVEANTASGMERPAARDGGEADLAGMAREQGAVGPAHQQPAEESRPRQLQVYDLTDGLGPLGTEFKARLEVEIHRPLSGPAAERRAVVASELEQLLEVHGVERAVGLVTSTCLAREGSGAPCVSSISGMLLVLRSMPPPRPDLLEDVRRYCPEWAEVLGALQRLPPGDQLTPGVLETLFLTLEASFKRGQLVLVAREPWQHSTIEAVYLTGLRRLVTETLGQHVGVDLRLAPQAVAGRA